MMTRVRRTPPRTAPWLAFVVPLAACSSPSHPAALGDCIPAPDASCFGTTTPPTDAQVSFSDGGVSVPPNPGSPGTCVAQSATIVDTKRACIDCVTASCCAVVTACSNTPCSFTLQCVQQGCRVGDTVCARSCEDQHPKDAQTYESLAKCLQTSCSTQCPVLTIGTNAE